MPFDDDADDAPSFGSPLPPDDRLWRHPSELGWAERADADAAGGEGARSRRWGLIVVAAVAGSAITVGTLAATTGLAPRVDERRVVERVPVRPTITETLAPGPGDDQGVAAVAEAVTPAVVRLEVSADGATSVGSGVVYRDDGHLITNAHVVVGADEVLVVLADGRQRRGSVVGSDPTTDIAVVAIEASGDGDQFPTAVLGSADDLHVGDPAVAIGSPLGLRGGPSVTVGVVSALGRRVEAASGVTLHDMIQTDAPIAVGSSGGALSDGSGVVVGITSAVAIDEPGGASLGFAIPIDLAHSVADDIVDTGAARHVWLGIEGGDLDLLSAETTGVETGAIVRRVLDDSPASASGLAAGDVIVSVDREPVDSMSRLIVLLREHDAGDAVWIEYVRDGLVRSARVTLEARD
jgi:putative serine protease PepD